MKKVTGSLSCAFLFCSVSIALLVLPGCTEPGPVVPVRGKVTLGQPIVDADIAVYHGETQVHAEYGETGRNGTFLLHVPLGIWEEDYILKATGGTIGKDGPAFKGTITATIVGHDNSHSYYDLNPVTTLVTAYMANHPEMSYYDAESAVKEFLGIPEHVDILTDLMDLEQYFSGQQFLVATEAAEDWDTFIEELALMVDEETLGSHPFVEPHAEKGFMAGLAAGAGQEIGMRVAGWTLDSLFGSSGGEPGPDMMAAIDDVRAELVEIRRSVNQLRSELKAVKEEIMTGQQQQTYNVIAALVDEDVSTIRTFHQRLVHLLGLAVDQRHGEQVIRDEIELLVEDIRSDDLLQRINHIHNVLTGAAPGQQGMYELYDNVLFAISYKHKHFEELAAFYTYWSHIQVQALNLLLEVDHFLHPDEPLYAELYMDEYIENIKAQSNLYLKAVEKQLSFVREPVESPAGAPNWESYSPGWAFWENTDPTTPEEFFNSVHYQFQSTTLRDADTRVAAMQGKERSTVIRIYVGVNWMGYPAPWGDQDLNDTDDDLRLRDGAGNIHTVETLTVYDIDHRAWTDYLPDRGRQMARYDFGELPYGNYRITNAFNDANPIPDVRFHGSYLRIKPIQPGYLDYVMNVDAYNPVNNMLIIFGGRAWW